MQHTLIYKTAEGYRFTYICDSFEEVVDLLEEADEAGLEGTFTYQRAVAKTAH